MNILVYKNAATAVHAVATLFAAQLIEKPDSVIGFSPAPIWKKVYSQLIEMTEQGLLDWSDVKAITPCERLGTFSEQEESIGALLYERLYGKVNLRPQNIRMPKYHQDISVLCSDFENTLLSLGKIDMLLLDFTLSGSIVCQEPANHFQAVAHVSTGDYYAPSVDSRTVTMGSGTMMAARKPIIFITGQTYAEAVDRFINGPITPTFPASILQLHQDAILILDEAAAVRL